MATADTNLLNIKVRTKLVEVLCILDDIQKFGYNEKECQRAQSKLVEAINILNSNNPN